MNAIAFFAFGGLIAMALPLIAFLYSREIEPGSQRRAVRIGALLIFSGTMLPLVATGLNLPDASFGPMVWAGLLSILVGIGFQWTAGRELGDLAPGPALRKLVWSYGLLPIVIAFALSAVVT